MESILDQLQSDEAILLMYVANELPADDRATVEARLKRDNVLRTRLDEIRGAHSVLDNAVARADATTPLPSSNSAARLFAHEIRSRKTMQRSRDDHEMKFGRGLRWLMYPTAAAAILAMGMFAWFRIATDADRENTPVVANENNTPWHWGRVLNTRVMAPDKVAGLSDDELLAAFDPLQQEWVSRSQASFMAQSSAIDYLDQDMQ